MLISRITIMLFGDVFSPKLLFDKLSKEVFISSFHEPSDFIEGEKENTYNYGYAGLCNPQKIGIQYELEEYQKWYIDFLVNNHKTMMDVGVEEIRFFIEIFYTKQCNFEIFNKEDLKVISNYNVSLPLSVYNVSDHEIIDMLVENNFSEERIKMLNIEEN